ncbi:MAG: hypothetical protein RR603_02505 [Kurthia sp.]
MNFILYLVMLIAVGFIVAKVTDGIKSRTLPQPDELTTQLSGVSAVQEVEQRPRMKAVVPNSHWFMHTFERPRRKGKK